MLADLGDIGRTRRHHAHLVTDIIHLDLERPAEDPTGNILRLHRLLGDLQTTIDLGQRRQR